MQSKNKFYPVRIFGLTRLKCVYKQGKICLNQLEGLRNIMKIKIPLFALLAAAGLALAGCSSPPGGKAVAWNISIEKKTTASIEVDLIGIATKSEENYWSGLSATDYWGPDSQVRKDQLKLGNMLTKFLQENHPWVLDRKDPQWNTWLSRGVNELYVVARLPEATGDWKIPLPLGKKSWDAKNRTLEIVVVDSGISVQTKSRD
jgi:hypothetical protein